MEISNQTAALRKISIKTGMAESQHSGIKPYIYAVTLAALLSTTGILWDISWHTTVGRDKFLSPPHILIYMGAIFGGLFSVIQVMINTFATPREKKGGFVKVWGFFYSSLGSMFCIWGAVAMLTSAPFDNWWHSAYGLDVKVFSPPHVLLILGICCLELGGCICITKYINLSHENDKSLLVLQVLFVITASSFLCLLYTIANPIIRVRQMRTAVFYQVATALTLLVLPAFRRALRMKWGMTAITIGYFLLAAIANWILQLFPAEPKLGPVLTHLKNFQPAMFPMFLMVPAVFMDIVMAKANLNDWIKAVLISVIFVLLLIAIEYPFSGFILQSPASRNWFFGGNAWYFQSPPDSPYRYKFSPADIQKFPKFAAGICIAVIIGTIIGRISLSWGNWMQRIQR